MLRTFAKKLSWRIIGRFTSDVLAFIFYATLARYFGESQMGDYASGFALAHLFAFAIELGIRPLLTRELARNKRLAPRYLGNILVTQTVLTIAAGTLLYLLANQSTLFSGNKAILFAAFLAIAIQSIGLTLIASLEAFEEMAKVAIVEISERTVVLLFGTMLILADMELHVVMSAYVLASMTFLALAFFWNWRIIGPLYLNIDIGLIRRILVASLPFLGASALNVLYSRIDVLMLYSFSGKAETGAYSIAYRCVESSLVVALMVGLTIYPALSRDSQANSTTGNPLFLGTLKWLGIFGLAGGLLLATTGDPVLLLIFGPEYQTSADLLRWMSILFVIGCVKVPYWRLMFASNRENAQLAFQLASIASNIILNFILIPKYGAYGAIAASTFSEIMLLTCFHVYCSRILKQPTEVRIPALLAVSFICLFIGLWGRVHFAWPYVVFFTALVFGLGLWITGVVTPAEKGLIGAMYRSMTKRRFFNSRPD